MEAKSKTPPRFKEANIAKLAGAPARIRMSKIRSVMNLFTLTSKENVNVRWTFTPIGSNPDKKAL